MNTTLVLEPANDSDLHLLLNLAQRLGVKATASRPTTPVSPEERRRLCLALAGSWQSDESGDEINQMLRESRHFRNRDLDATP